MSATTLEEYVIKHYRDIRSKCGDANTEQLRIRHHAYAVGAIAAIMKPLFGREALNLRGDTFAERLAHVEEIVEGSD